MTEVLSLLLGVAVVLGITLLTGYFVAQGVAYTAVDPGTLFARAEAGDTTAQRALGGTPRRPFLQIGRAHTLTPVT